MKNRKKIRKFFRKKIFGVEKSKFANRLKRALPKFRGDRSGGRGVNGRSKFVAASAGRAQRKQFFNMEVKAKVDESLIGGVVIKAEDTVIDDSVRGRLGKLSQVLN